MTTSQRSPHWRMPSLITPKHLNPRCRSVAGSLMSIDEEGFLALERHADALAGAEKVMAFAKAMLRCAKTVTMPHNGQPTQVRVGLHTGPVVTGLIGTKLPKFSIFGTYPGSGRGTGERGFEEEGARGKRWRGAGEGKGNRGGRERGRGARCCQKSHSAAFATRHFGSFTVFYRHTLAVVCRRHHEHGVANGEHLQAW